MSAIAAWAAESSYRPSLILKSTTVLLFWSDIDSDFYPPAPALSPLLRDGGWGLTRGDAFWSFCLKGGWHPTSSALKSPTVYRRYYSVYFTMLTH